MGTDVWIADMPDHIIHFTVISFGSGKIRKILGVENGYETAVTDTIKIFM